MYGASIQPCALPTMPAAITGSAGSRFEPRAAGFVERLVEAAARAAFMIPAGDACESSTAPSASNR